MRIQQAIFHGPGECSSIMLMSRRMPEAQGAAAAKEALLERVARLMWVFEKRDQGWPYAPRNLHVLVAVKAALLPETGRSFTEFPEHGMQGLYGKMQRGDGSADVFVQVSAPTETDRRYALRLARGILQGHVPTELKAGKLAFVEVHGARIFSGLEPFGYRDGGPSESDGVPRQLLEELRRFKAQKIPEALWAKQLEEKHKLPAGSAKDPCVQRILERALAYDEQLRKSDQGSELAQLSCSGEERKKRRKDFQDSLTQVFGSEAWLLYQRYEHDLDRQSSIDPVKHVGREPLGATPTTAQAGPGSHLAVAKADVAAGIYRRGFAYRDQAGTEGLAFVCLANDPSKFAASLGRHLDEDSLLQFTSARSSGVYRVPPSSDWLVEACGLQPLEDMEDPIPPAAKVLLRPGDPIPCLVNYQVIPQVIEYVQLARAHGLFLEPSMALDPRLERIFDGLEKALGSADSELKDLRAEIRRTAEQLYAFNGSYFSLGI